MWVCMYVYACLYVCAHVLCMCAHVYMCMCVHMCACMCVHVHIHQRTLGCFHTLAIVNNATTNIRMKISLQHNCFISFGYKCSSYGISGSQSLVLFLKF
jgi:hypothetical protein